MKPLSCFRLSPLLSIAALALAALLPASLRASDHADGPTVAGDQAADLADCYMFVDPDDDTKVVIINTVRGFIVPGEAGNFAIFDSTIRYRFQIENTGPVNEAGKPIPSPGPSDADFDPAPDAFIDVTFSKKTSAAPQVATVVFSGSAFAGIAKGKYVGNATAAGLGPNPPANYFPNPAQQLKAAPKKGQTEPGAAIPVDFFAGEVDDPFFFDIPGFARFRDRFLNNLKPEAGMTREEALNDAAPQLSRGRDTFAGYNVMAIAFRLPIAQLRSKNVKITNDTKFGLNVLAQRKTEKTVRGEKVGIGAYRTVDREGLPAVNALLVPLPQKNAYNGGTTIDDSKGKFATGILDTLNALKVPEANINFLAALAVRDGDFLRIDTAAAAGFPNGRLPADDVVDILLTVIAGTPVGDSVPANDEVNGVGFSPTFPFLQLPHQPRDAGVLDDNTRN